MQTDLWKSCSNCNHSRTQQLHNKLTEHETKECFTSLVFVLGLRYSDASEICESEPRLTPRVPRLRRCGANLQPTENYQTHKVTQPKKMEHAPSGHGQYESISRCIQYTSDHAVRLLYVVLCFNCSNVGL